MSKRNSVPAYRHHKARDCAVVTLLGRNFYLGPFGSAESKERYARLIAEHAAGPTLAPRPLSHSRAVSITVTELCANYVRWADGYYRKHGRSTGQSEIIRAAMKSLRKLYGTLPASDFTCRELEAVRQSLLDERRLSRGGVNRRTNLIRRAFRWAEVKALVPKGTWHHLQTLEPLRMGRTDAREMAPVRPVDDTTVQATICHLPSVVADMVRFHRFVGCRPTEVCIIRPGDVDTTGEIWVYVPSEHKVEHHGRDRQIFIGPKAQDVLRPYLLRAADAFCFSPAESERKRYEVLHERRKTRVQPSQQSRRKSKPIRTPQQRYDHHAYNRAIRRAVDKANLAQVAALASALGREPLKAEAVAVQLPHWHSNQLRHAKATEVRKLFGIEGAQVILGHADCGVSQVYAERDAERAAQIAMKIG